MTVKAIRESKAIRAIRATSMPTGQSWKSGKSVKSLNEENQAGQGNQGNLVVTLGNKEVKLLIKLVLKTVRCAIVFLCYSAPGRPYSLMGGCEANVWHDRRELHLQVCKFVGICKLKMHSMFEIGCFVRKFW